jgi:hypothetical protein
LVGFNATFLQFANDAGITPATGKTGREMAMRSIKSSPKLTKVNLQSQDGMRFDPVTSPKKFNENRSLVVCYGCNSLSLLLPNISPALPNYLCTYVGVT